jgi:DNA-binding MarR family transcriptional regulator
MRDGQEPAKSDEPPEDRPGRIPQDRESGVLLGREFITAVVVFHDSVGRLLGVSAVERKCLDVLARKGPMTAGAIAEHTGLTSGAVTGLIDRLRTAGYVDRAVDPSDRRRVLVSLRPDTKLDQVKPKVFGPLGADMAAVTARYQPDELRVIADFLSRTTDVLVANTARISQLEF